METQTASSRRVARASDDDDDDDDDDRDEDETHERMIDRATAVPTHGCDKNTCVCGKPHSARDEDPCASDIRVLTYYVASATEIYTIARRRTWA